ncbi:MAG: hypothetical protein R6X35_15735, partial [Candidatus Krumholzibacteriia bacterium]
MNPAQSRTPGRSAAALLVLGALVAGAVATSVTPAPVLAQGTNGPPALSDLVLLPGDDRIGPAAGWQQEPAIARGGDQYLAVWTDGRTDLHGIANFGSGPYQDLDL